MTSLSLRESWIGWRNRRLSDSRFQQWAAETPPFRAIAKRRAQALFDLVAGFVYSQTLGACVRLRLLQLLADGPKTTMTVAAFGGMSVEAAQRLLTAARALRLVDQVGLDRHALGPQGAALLGNPGLVEMIEHHALLYADLNDPVALLRNGKGGLSDYWGYATSPTPQAGAPADVAAYSALMAATQPAVAADLLRAYPLGRHARVLDVGGGEGAFLQAAGVKAPNLQLMLFDLPAVTTRARERLGKAGLLQRTQIYEGDFLRDPLPWGADLITMVRILHDQDDEGVLALLRAARAALPANGALLIAEPMASAGKPDRVAEVYFAFYLLAMGRGRARSPPEIFEHLRQAGFSKARALRTRSPFLLRAILARP